jgi:zinc transport system ATP-binding protein
VAMGLFTKKITSKKSVKNDKNNGEKIDEALKKADALNLKGRLFYSLSGGERQKVSLARCYCQNAKILLLDEPSSFLDVQSKKTFLDQMKKLEQEDFSVIAVTHDEEIIKELNWKTVRFYGKEKSEE